MQLTCHVTVKTIVATKHGNCDITPVVTVDCGTVLVVSVTDNWVIEITPAEELYYVDDVIKCTVPAEPNANIRWEPVMDPHIMPIYSPSLEIKEDMVGEDVWKCVAYDFSGHIVERVFRFNVTGA